MSSPAYPVLNRERIPASGALVIPGRLDHPQLVQIEKLFPNRQITWLIAEGDTLAPKIRTHLEGAQHGAMFTPGDAEPARVGHQLESALQNGGVIVFVPGQASTRDAAQCHIPAGHLETLCAFGLPVLPIALDCPRESCLAVENPAALPAAVLSIGKPIAADKASAATFLASLYEAHEEAFSSRSLLKGSLAVALLKGLKQHGGKHHVFDGSDDIALPYDRLLGAAIALSKHLRKETEAQRIGIILPPGKGGLLANLAVLFAGKIPVNLNFTASHDAVQSAMRQAGLDCYITADPFVRKLSDFPWPPRRDTLFIEQLVRELQKEMKKWVILAKLLPASWLANHLGLHERSDRDEAILLFTSGSSGEPKGVPLTHRNVLANVCQFATRLHIPPNSAVLGCLPLFHSFGCTVTLWFPVIEGLNLVTYPSPLETKRLGELVKQQNVNLLLSTPTFLRGFMKRVDPAQLAPVHLVVTGAEKLPQNLADAFEERFGKRPQEGYGLTETSPATNVNLPDLAHAPGTNLIPSSRSGSVGVLLPGMAVRITDPSSDAILPINQQGIIWLKGSNVFDGYLNDAKKTADVLHDGWFRTGDVGRIDSAGFLYIEGRISRFSKIGGEMVPHETVEAAINKVLGLDGETERRVAIVGVPDAQKGEALVLLSSIAGISPEQECIDLRYKLLDAGLPSLWCPKQIQPVDHIPVLASGKLDIKGCESLVKK